jgi:FkbM family methyltransferase
VLAVRATIRHSRQVIRFITTHPANRGRRGRQILRAVLFQIRGRMRMSTVTRIGDRSWMRVDLHYRGGAKVVYANPPDFDEMMTWRRLLRDGDLFVDVGANVGSYSLWAAERGAEVIAIEPHPVTAAQLRRNAALNDYPIEVRQLALAESVGTMRLTSDLDARNHLMLGAGRPRGPQRRADDDGIDVEVSTLDDVIGARSPVFVKIDVEGAEELVLRGGVRALAEGRIAAIQLEWNGLSRQLFGYGREVVADLLCGYGFALCRPDADTGFVDCGPSPQLGADVFALRPEAIARLAATG